MQAGTDIDQWLRGLPLDEPVQVDGETIYLNVLAGGAEIGAVVTPSWSQSQFRTLLNLGFAQALAFPAGLGLRSDGTLVLTQWLPDVAGWPEVADSLESLLDQLAQWKSSLQPEATNPFLVAGSGRVEHRIRSLIAGAT